LTSAKWLTGRSRHPRQIGWTTVVRRSLRFSSPSPLNNCGSWAESAVL
jgi:hypothetical protein